jgi:membrane-associated phospholipid phosphatase
MPSGDAIQSALFIIYLYYLGVPGVILVIFHIGVCLGRVYYMCHWLMDTIVSTILGAGIACALSTIR